jgi:hypothetical protein
MTCTCGAPTTHSGCCLCMPSRTLCRPPCLLCADWSGIERRPLLPVRPNLQRRSSHFQLPHDHPGAHALVFSSLSRGWTNDHDLPFIVTDVPLSYAEWLPWAGQA